MMRIRLAWVLVALVACTKAGSDRESASAPEPTIVIAQAKPPAPAPPPPAPPKKVAKVTVQMTAATLADDCGHSALPAATDTVIKAKAKSARFAKADRACDQTSMQLSIKMPADGRATQLTVKKVELFDDKGVKIGALTPRTPTIWSEDGMYKTWDQKITPGLELSVSYALSQPAWGAVPERRNRTYVLKAVVTVSGGDQVVQHDVQISAPTSLPPGAKT